MMTIRLTPKQHYILQMSAKPNGVWVTKDFWPTSGQLEKKGLATRTSGTLFKITPKGRAVLNVIETGAVTMFQT